MYVQDQSINRLTSCSMLALVRRSHAQEKPTNCGTEAADVLENFFLASKHNANPLNIVMHLQLPLTSQRLSVQSVTPSDLSIASWRS